MLKRDPTKYIRDLAKSGYKKGPKCEICDATEQLQLHHYYTVAILVSRWKKPLPETREEFIAAHENELYVEVATLCKTCHTKLHSVYGKNPALGTAAKQKNWVQIQHGKLVN